MNVAAFDLSLTATGWAVWLGPDLSSPAYGLFTGPAVRGMERIARIRDCVLRRAAGADLVVLEGYSFASRTSHVREIGELGGVIRLAFYEAGQPVADISPSSLKKYATGKGNAKKDAVLAEAIRRLNYPGHDHNETDALWLLHMALDAYSEALVEMPKVHREALEKVKWPLDRRL